jgi:hypothetical protein
VKISSLKVIRPRTAAMLSIQQQETLRLAIEAADKRHYKKSAKLFGILAAEMHASGPPLSEDTAAMKANEALLAAKVEMSRNRSAAEMCLNKALDAISEALKPDEYWADYVFFEEKLRTFTHTEFGCKITRNKNGSWEVRCIDVSNALGIPGLSRSESFDLECSICGADPMYCPHIRGETYGGRLAVGIIKNLKINHIAIIINRLPQESNIGILPRPLTDADIRNIFSEGKAKQILATNEMRCLDLIRVIREKQLGGTDFVPPRHH